MHFSAQRLICFSLYFALSLPLQAAEQPALTVPYIPANMQVDGVLDEPFWQQAAVTQLIYENEPGENLPASIQTHVYVVDSGKSLRVAFVAEDPDPKKIQAFLRDRDSAFQDDFVGLRLDTFNSQQRALEFFVNARGVQMDLSYNENAGHNNKEDESWDTIWDSSAQITEHGYTVEMEIPYSSLKFKHSDTPQSWGVNFMRVYPRANRFVFSDQRMDRNNKCDLCQQAQLLGFNHADPGKNILVNPTLTAGKAQSRLSPDQAFESSATHTDFGLDLSWSPTPNNTLSATYNPDFSQIEIDGAQLNVNTNFALYFPEKRPFFLDSADYFSTPGSQLVYTRNIADPNYGLRATGRNDAHTYGAFFANDATTNILRPGPFSSHLTTLDGPSNDWVGTYRYDLNSMSNIGVLMTQRQGTDYSNTMASLDGKWQSSGNTLIVQWMHSDTNDALGYRAQPFSGDSYLINYDYSDRNKSFMVGRRWVDPGFRADMGFIGQVDFDRWVSHSSYRWYPEHQFINRVQVNAEFKLSHQLSTSLQIQRQSELGINFQGAMQSFIEANIGQRMQYWKGNNYNQNYLELYTEFTPVSTWKLSLSYRGGDQIDFNNNALGRIISFQPGVRGNIGTNGSIEFNYIDEALKRDGGSVYHAKLVDSRFSWQFNLRQRLRLAVQYGTTTFDPLLNNASVDLHDTNIGTQLVYSYKINPRSVFYAGYSDGYFGNDSVTTFQTNRSLFLKFGYAWQP